MKENGLILTEMSKNKEKLIAIWVFILYSVALIIYAFNVESVSIFTYILGIITSIVTSITLTIAFD